MEASFSWKPDKMSIEFEKKLCDDDWKAEIDVELDAKPIKNEYECSGKIKF